MKAIRNGANLPASPKHQLAFIFLKRLCAWLQIKSTPKLMSLMVLLALTLDNQHIQCAKIKMAYRLIISLL